MQFTVLIEFLVPGLATSVLLVYLWFNGTMPELPQGLNLGDTIAALILLAVSYPIGILTNFPVYELIQVRLISPRMRRRILKDYAGKGIDLTELVSDYFSISLSNRCLDEKEQKGNEDEQTRTTFHLIRAFAFAQNIERLNSNHLYHESLQRLGRGMFLPLLLATIALFVHRGSLWALLVGLCGLLAWSAGALIVHSVRTEEEQLVRFFLVITHKNDGQPNQSLSTCPPRAA